MPFQEFNRNNLKIKKLSERISKISVSSIIEPESQPPAISKENLEQIKNIAVSIIKAKADNSPVIIAIGAHVVKNGLSKILIKMIEQGYIHHLLANGATSIHDWELAYQGKTSEDVKYYVSQGQFGLWEETGLYLNLAIKEGAKNNLGYGESIGKFIHEEKILSQKITHPCKSISILASAYKNNIPFSISLGIGNDIIHMHPECSGEALGKTSYIDFLRFANTVQNLEHGVLISIGSAITAPMCFEKALSMSNNIAKQKNTQIKNFKIFVNDIQPSDWEWSNGEPPMDNPAYYLRFFKTYSRMAQSEYIQLDNRAFLHNLYNLLNK